MAENPWVSLGLFDPYKWNLFHPILMTERIPLCWFVQNVAFPPPLLCFSPCLKVCLTCPVSKGKPNPKQKKLPSWETNIFPYQVIFEDVFPFPKVGYVSFLEGNHRWFVPQKTKTCGGPAKGGPLHTMSYKWRWEKYPGETHLFPAIYRGHITPFITIL